MPSLDVSTALGASALSARIQREVVLGLDGLRVISGPLDPVLLDGCGALLASAFGDARPTKVVTGANFQDHLPAQCVARHLRIPMVFANSGPMRAPVGSAAAAEELDGTLSADYQGATCVINKDYLAPSDRVVIVYNILASGETIVALRRICEQAGAAVVGVGVVVDKRSGLDGQRDLGENFTALVRVRAGEGDAEGDLVVSPPARPCVVPPSVAADALCARIMEEGTVLPGNMLKVYSFVNHQVDTRLMDMCGELVSRIFASFGITKVLTAATGGMPPAQAVATALRVPLVCAREAASWDVLCLDRVYASNSESRTKKTTVVLHVEKEFLTQGDKVLVVDDFLATGTTGVALHRLCEQAGVEVEGMAFLVEKRFQGGMAYLLEQIPHLQGRVVSLSSIASMSESGGVCLDQDVTGRCALVEVPPADLMIERILRDGKPAPGGRVDATAFINSQVDPDLMHRCGLLMAKRFVDARITAVLTAQTAGVAPALAAAFHLRVPLVCARRYRSAASDDVHPAVQPLRIADGDLQKGDVVLVVGDFLATGATALSLMDLCERIGAGVVGLAYLVENSSHGGRGRILGRVPQLCDDILALTTVLSVEQSGLRVQRCTEERRVSWARVAESLARRMSSEVTVDAEAKVLKFRSLMGFHNSMDPNLLDACGEVLAAQFAGVTKVLCGAPVQSLAVAQAVSRYLGVPMVFARTKVPLTMKGQRTLEADLDGTTLHVSAEFISKQDNVLIADDFMASGSSALALQRLCEQAGASVAGVALLARNRTTLYGQGSHAPPRGTTDAALAGLKIVALVEVIGGATACRIDVAPWLAPHRPAKRARFGDGEAAAAASAALACQQKEHLAA